MDWLGTDVRDVLGPTLTSIARGPRSTHDQYVPFSGTSRRDTIGTLQGMYTALRGEGAWCTLEASERRSLGVGSHGGDGDVSVLQDVAAR